MPYSRQRPRVPAGGRASIHLSPEQRDWLIHSVDTPRDLGHALHRAPVRQGKLSLRVTREELDALIRAAAAIAATDKQMERTVAALLRYLESVEDRFEDENASEEPN